MSNKEAGNYEYDIIAVNGKESGNPQNQSSPALVTTSPVVPPDSAQCSPIKPGTGSVSTPERYPGYADVSPENDRRDNPSVVVRGIPPPQKDPVN